MKKVIAIVAGGYSSEHDVSLRSAEGILSFMDNEKYDSYVVDIEKNKWTARYGDELCQSTAAISPLRPVMVNISSILHT